MRGSRFGSSLFVALLAITFCATLSASPIIGTFNFGGNITATTTTISWSNTDVGNTPNEATIGGTGTGVFSMLVNGGTIAIAPLNSAVEPSNNPDAPFSPPVPFIAFNPVTGLPTLDINQVFHGFESAADCSTNVAAAAAGQVCTVPGPPTSPFNFTNNPGIQGATQATATFVFSGVSGGNLWQANFTAQFAVPFQQVLLDLSTGGSVTNTYSATVTEFAGTTNSPEPPASALMGLGLGLVGLAAVLRRRRLS